MNRYRIRYVDPSHTEGDDPPTVNRTHVDAHSEDHARDVFHGDNPNEWTILSVVML